MGIIGRYKLTPDHYDYTEPTDYFEDDYEDMDEIDTMDEEEFEGE